jgi:hypothetical protein
MLHNPEPYDMWVNDNKPSKVSISHCIVITIEVITYFLVVYFFVSPLFLKG